MKRKAARGLPPCDGREGKGGGPWNIKMCRCPRCAVLRYTALHRGNRDSHKMIGAVLARMMAENA
jgi:hypothetical protein